MIVLGLVRAVASIATVVRSRVDGGGAVDGGKALGGGPVLEAAAVTATVVAGGSSIAATA